MQKERARGNRQGKEEEQSVYSVKGITTSLGLGDFEDDVDEVSLGAETSDDELLRDIIVGYLLSQEMR